MRGSLIAIAGFTLAGLSTAAVISFGGEAKPSGKNILDNALRTHNGGPLNDLIIAAISSEAISQHATLAPLLATDPYAHKFFEYLMQCALPEGESVTLSHDGELYEFQGAVGLAPEWLEGPCEQACQEWVSACMFARVNTFGVTVGLYLDGDHPAFASKPGDPVRGDTGYIIEEGGFYGNMFLDVPRQYTCRGEGNDPLYLSFRVCSKPGSLCGLTNVGVCGEIDGDTGEPSVRHACSEKSADGKYLSCRNRTTLPGTDEFPEPNFEYRRIVTTFLPRTTFSDGLRAGTCVTDKPDGGVIEDGGVEGPTTGTRCDTDDDCNSDTHYCDVTVPNFLCTSPCTNESSQRLEQEQCGGAGTTCLDIGGTGVCTRSCTPGQRFGAPGTCGPGLVCTTSWLNLDFPDAPGCSRSCSRDSDCNNGVNCNERSGACGLPDNPSGVADGFPCPLDEPDFCRGVCFRLVASSTIGACGSAINRAVDPQCPDDPQLIPPFGPDNDDLGICIFRRCETDDDCVAPLGCYMGENGKICTMI